MWEILIISKTTITRITTTITTTKITTKATIITKIIINSLLQKYFTIAEKNLLLETKAAVRTVLI